MNRFNSLLKFTSAVLDIKKTKHVGGFSQGDWMSKIDGKKLLSELSIPGTHNSCALYEPLYNLGKCQNYTVFDQLNMGVRFLDLRVYIEKGELCLAHGILPQCITLRDVLTQCYAFLEIHPTESLIMSIKNERSDSDDDIAEYLNRFVNDNRDMWYTESKIPSLDECRGKIVLLKRFNTDEIDGIDGSRGWNDNASFIIEKDNFSLFVQDRYTVKAVSEKTLAVCEYLSDCKSVCRGKPQLCICFISGCLTGLPRPLTVAEGLNPFITEYASNGKKKFMGAVLVDYTNESICNAIINTNF
jgi:1-phosphatidylinositol phosphodiesterase